MAFEKFETSSLFYVSEWDIFTFLTEIFQFTAGLWKLIFMCHKDFFEQFFSPQKLFFYQNCLRILSKKTFRLLRKIFAGLAILHPVSFDEYSDVSFWRESTLIKNSSFEEKEQKTIWFYSKSPPFFWEQHSVFSEHPLRFFGKKSKLITSFGIWAKRPGVSAKTLRKVLKTAFHISKETMREN